MPNYEQLQSPRRAHVVSLDPRRVATTEAFVIRTYRYRILPNRRQHRALRETLEAQRQLYNGALEERVDAYRKAGIRRTYFDQCAALTEWRRADPEAAGLPLGIQRHTLKRVDLAFNAFFRRVRQGGKPGFPRFKGERRFRTFGFREFEGVSLEGPKVRFKGMPGSLRVHFHRSLPPDARIKSCTFTMDVKGWKIALVVEMPLPMLRGGNNAIGVDLGITDLAVMSDGDRVPSLRAARRSAAKVRRLQRALSRKCRASVGREKARHALTSAYAKVSRERLNHLHAASARLVRAFDLIAVESLPIAGMARGLFAKQIYDASWGRFLSMLRYKAENAGVRLVEVDSRNTTRDCSACGAAVPKALRERWHCCAACGLSIDRDVNAALNVLRRAGVGPGLHNVAELGVRAGGSLVGSPSGFSGETLPNSQAH